MTRDLTDHVRERDEAAGEHRPVTDKEAASIEAVLDEFVDIGVGNMEIPGCSNDTARRLLRDRDVAMEMIKEAADIAEMVEADYEEAYDFRVKARALIAAVKEEEE
ncbi:hypothetical protein LCGC14_0394370 [marine sediment metagenome]|uniref:Uncharacterized protein n=1 Tax=marine sediment metagenome TaxID=412755 RepID=A0A0F9TGR6_9ZZZZ